MDLNKSKALGFAGPVCYTCRTGHYTICGLCGQKKKSAGFLDNGSPVCERCKKLGVQEFICPKCSKSEKVYNETSCRDCFYKEVSKRLENEALATLTKPWIKNWYSGFMEEFRRRAPGLEAILRHEFYAGFFKQLECAVDRADEIDLARLFEIFGGMALRRYLIPFNYLRDARLIPGFTDEDLVAVREAEQQKKVIEKTRDTWRFPVLVKFQSYLYGIQNRIKAREKDGSPRGLVSATITTRIVAAEAFLSSCGATHSVQGIQQKHLDLFIGYHSGYRRPIRHFIGFLNNKCSLFNKLEMEAQRERINLENLLSPVKQKEVFDACIDPPDSELKSSIIVLFMSLYAQSSQKITKLLLISRRRFLEECLLDCVEGVTKLAPPQYSRGQAPVYDKTLHCWNLIELTGKSVTHQMDKT